MPNILNVIFHYTDQSSTAYEDVTADSLHGVIQALDHCHTLLPLAAGREASDSCSLPCLNISLLFNVITYAILIPIHNVIQVIFVSIYVRLAVSIFPIMTYIIYVKELKAVSPLTRYDPK